MFLFFGCYHHVHQLCNTWVSIMKKVVAALFLVFLLPCIYGGCKSVTPKDEVAPKSPFLEHPAKPFPMAWDDIEVVTSFGMEQKWEQDIHKLTPATLNDSLNPEARPFFDYYRSLTPCQKVNYIDSMFHAQTDEKISNWRFLYTSTHTNNFYYYIIYDMILMTGINSSSLYNYPYLIKDPASTTELLVTAYSGTFNCDIERWKEKLGCTK